MGMHGEGQERSLMVKNVFSAHELSPIFARASSPSGLASVLSFPHPHLFCTYCTYFPPGLVLLSLVEGWAVRS